MSQIPAVRHHNMALFLGGMGFQTMPAFPEDPVLNTLYSVGNGLYSYQTFGDVDTFYPLIRPDAQATYLHKQQSLSKTWTVEHKLGTEDIWWVVKDMNGDYNSPISIVPDRDDPLNKIVVTFAAALSGTMFIVGSKAFTTALLRASVIEVGGVFKIDSSGMTINGTYVDLATLLNPPNGKDGEDGLPGHDGTDGKDGTNGVMGAKDTGAVNALAADFTPALTEYTSEMVVAMTVAHTNTGATTINLNGLGAVPVKKLSANGSLVDLVAGDLKAGAATFFIYDGAVFQAMLGGLGQVSSWSGVDTGIVNALMATLLPAPLGYTSGMRVMLQISKTNTGPTTINLNGLGAVPVKKAQPDGTLADLDAGDLDAGVEVEFTYNGTAFQLMGGLSGAVTYWPGIDAGVVNALALTITSGPKVYSLGLTAIVKVAITNTAASTININNIGAVLIKKRTQSGLVDVGPGDLTVGNLAELVYDGTFFQLGSTGPTSPMFNMQGLWYAPQVPASMTLVDAATVGIAPLPGEALLRQLWKLTTTAVRVIGNPDQTKLLGDAVYQLNLTTGGFNPSWSSMFDWAWVGGAAPAGLTGRCIFYFLYDASVNKLCCIGYGTGG